MNADHAACSGSVMRDEPKLWRQHAAHGVHAPAEQDHRTGARALRGLGLGMADPKALRIQKDQVRRNIDTSAATRPTGG